MRLSSVGPNTIVEAFDLERTEPAVEGEGVAQPQASQLETHQENSTQSKIVGGNLTNLIEEAKKRAGARKMKGLVIKRSLALRAYEKILSLEDSQSEKGVNLDQRS